MSEGLGWHPGPVDERDHELAPRLAAVKEPITRGSVFRHTFASARLDQGREGSCVGHAWAHLANASPRMRRYDHPFAYGLYKRAQEAFDEWPGTDYEGTSIRAGAKAAVEAGIITAYAFSYDLAEIAYWLLNTGTIVIGVDWMSGMDNPSPENNHFIEPTGRVRGGHAITVDGVRWMQDGSGDDYFRLLNSWSPRWGDKGRCRITAEDLQTLLGRPYATACTATEG